MHISANKALYYYSKFILTVTDGKYHMLPTGELLVFSVTSADAHASYRCRTVHHVTGSTVESSTYAHLVVTGKLRIHVLCYIFSYYSKKIL